MNDKYELVRFEQNGLTLDVNVSPNEDTVWLSKEQIAVLFGRDRSVISKHIKHLFEEQEVEKSNVHFLHIANSDKPVPFYSLDVIISVGYRVKSKNGVVFRKWANVVLKEYLLRGYVIDSERTLVTNENYVNLINKVDSIDARLTKIEGEYIANPEKVFFNGEYLDARAFIEELFSEATSRIVIVDSYADAKALDYLSSKREGVSVALIISPKAKLTQDDVNAFNLQYGGLAVYDDDSFHDRFIGIDDRVLYHLGASLNYGGKRTFAITKLSDEHVIAGVLTRIRLIAKPADNQ